MGTILKYLFYVLVIAAIYFIGVSFYQGNIMQDSTLKEVKNEVTSEATQAIKDGYNATKDAITDNTEE